MSATEELYRSYLDLRWHFDPASATAAGLTSEDHRLGSYDAGAMRIHLAAFRSMASAAEQLEVQHRQEEIDRTAFLDEVRVTLFRFEYERPHLRNPAFWLGHLFECFHGLLRRPGSLGMEGSRALIARLEATPGFLQAALETLEEPSDIFLESALLMVAGGQTLIRETASTIASSLPELSEAASHAATEAGSALERFESALSELKAHPDNLWFAVGEDQFNRRLHHEHALQANAPELYRYGLHLLDEVEAEVAALAAALRPRRSWRDVVADLRASAPADPDTVAAYAAEMERAKSFVEARRLASLPAGALAVTTTPSFLRPLSPVASYMAPGPYAPTRDGVFYVTPHALCAYEVGVTALHEGYPGHHLHLATACGLASEVRRLTWTPITVEGWALYCEEMMGEQGFFLRLEERLFQRLHLLWRAARIVLDVGLHTRGMTPAAATDFLVDRVAMDRGQAESEVRRYCAMPTYQLCYAVGRREILRLRHDYQARAGGDFSLHGFHQDFLGYGGLPVALIRWGMELEDGEQ